MARRNVYRPSIRRQLQYGGIIAEFEQRKAVESGRSQAEAKMETVGAPDLRDPLEIARAAAAALRGDAA